MQNGKNMVICVVRGRECYGISMQIKRNPCYLLGVHGVGFDSACEGGYGGRYGETLQRTDARDPETEGDERDDQNTKGVRPQTRAPSERASKG